MTNFCHFYDRHEASKTYLNGQSFLPTLYLNKSRGLLVLLVNLIQNYLFAFPKEQDWRQKLFNQTNFEIYF